MRMSFSLGVALMLSVVLAGPAVAQQRPQPREVCAGPECHLLCLDADDNGTTVHLRRGELVMVSLVGNPSTGSDWHLEALDQQVVRPLCNAFTPFRPELLGSSGLWHGFYQADAPGETVLLLEYYRHWEGSSTASDSFTVTFVVH